MHTSDAYRDAIGEEGRAKNLEMIREAVELDVTNHFAFSPKMSYVPKAWVDADPRSGRRRLPRRRRRSRGAKQIAIGIADWDVRSRSRSFSRICNPQ